MTNIFIRQPMNSKTDDEIRHEHERAVQYGIKTIEE